MNSWKGDIHSAWEQAKPSQARIQKRLIQLEENIANAIHALDGVAILWLNVNARNTQASVRRHTRSIERIVSRWMEVPLTRWCNKIKSKSKSFRSNRGVWLHWIKPCLWIWLGAIAQVRVDAFLDEGYCCDKHNAPRLRNAPETHKHRNWPDEHIGQQCLIVLVQQLFGWCWPPQALQHSSRHVEGWDVNERRMDECIHTKLENWLLHWVTNTKPKVEAKIYQTLHEPCIAQTEHRHRHNSAGIQIGHLRWSICHLYSKISSAADSTRQQGEEKVRSFRGTYLPRLS